MKSTTIIPPAPFSCKACGEPLVNPVWSPKRNQWQQYCDSDCYHFDSRGKTRRSLHVVEALQLASRGNNRRWTPADRKLLEEMYTQEEAPLANIAIRLGRSIHSIQVMANHSGFRRSSFNWSTEEVATLISIYPDLDKTQSDIEASLPDRSWPSIMSMARVLNVKRVVNMQYDVVSDYFSVIDNDEKAYWLGFLAADGCVSGKNKIEIGLSEKDEVLLRQLANTICDESQIRSRPKTNSLRLLISDSRMRGDLESYGIVPRKSYCLVWPAKLPEKYSMPFILGLFDGDGCLCWCKGYWRWSIAGTETILNDVKSRIEDTIGIRIGSVLHRRETSMCTLSAGGSKAVIIDALMSTYPIGLSRKRIYGHPHTVGVSSRHDIGGI